MHHRGPRKNTKETIKMPNTDDLQAYLATHIPLSTAMQVHVAIAEDNHIELRAPLAPNVNHRGTVFGGSIASLATLACWSLLWVRTRDWEPAPHLVVRRSKIDYDHPAQGEFRAIARIPPEMDWELPLLAAHTRHTRSQCDRRHPGSRTFFGRVRRPRPGRQRMKYASMPPAFS